jgi:hypothetical protein
MKAARGHAQCEQPPAHQSSDIGSTPATFQSNVPAGIVSRDRAARETQELARASLRSDMALAEIKIHLDLAAAGKIDPAVQPIALYLFNNDLVLTAIESGSYAASLVAIILRKSAANSR